MRHTAPWPDHDGNQVMEGDRIVHPSGDTGIVVFHPDKPTDADRWGVDYGCGHIRSLCVELSAAVRATVIDETGKFF